MDYKKSTDSELVAAYRAGDSQAMDALVSRHRRRVLDYIHMMVKDRAVADDIHQETLIKALHFIDQERYVDNGKFISWVLRIAHNQVIDHFRRLRQQNLLKESDAGYDILNSTRFAEPTIEEQMINHQIDKDVVKLIHALPREQRDVVWLRYCRGMSFREIAEQTGVSINTALGRMRYALINMRKIVEENKMILV